jgi:hypothetical protein
MSNVSFYTPTYIAACRQRFADQLQAYLSMVEGSSAPNVGEFERKYCRALLLALDNCFATRSRSMEGRDGNPLNEVRILCKSIIINRGKLMADAHINLSPGTSVLGLAVGDDVDLNARDFARISSAFFDSIERTYGAVAA